MMKQSKLGAALLSVVALQVSPAMAQPAAGFCATEEQKSQIADAFAAREGVPTMIYARNTGLPELTVASGLPASVKSYGAEATPDRVKEVWASIDSWGGEASTHVVFTMGGDHVADFPSLIPLTQPDDGSGFIDIYADNGDGVHGHVFLDLVKAIYAAELPGPTGVTRMVSLYNEDGSLIVAIYPSIGAKPFDQRAIDGFNRTFEQLKEYAPHCG